MRTKPLVPASTRSGAKVLRTLDGFAHLDPVVFLGPQVTSAVVDRYHPGGQQTPPP